MPQKDKDARKEYNHQQYLKRKQSQNKTEPTKSEDNAYYILRHHKQMLLVNTEYLQVKLKAIKYKCCLPQELLNEIENIDNVKMFIKHFNKVAILENGFCTIKRNGNGSNYFSCVFGDMFLSGIKHLTIEVVTKQLKPSTKQRRYECGIEVLGMKPNRTADGKYKYEGISIADLRQSCKMNNIKGYTSLDKLELVKILMKI